MFLAGCQDLDFIDSMQLGTNENEYSPMARTKQCADHGAPAILLKPRGWCEIKFFRLGTGGKLPLVRKGGNV